MNNEIFIFVCMLFCHIVDDYYLQGWLASAKQKEWWQKNAPDLLYKNDYQMALMMHSMSWAFSIMIPLAVINKWNIGLFLINRRSIMNLWNIPEGYVMSEQISSSIYKKTIQIVVPQEISNHPILVKNIKELPIFAFQFIECEKVYLSNLKIVGSLFFDSEKEKYRKKMNETIKEKNKLKDLMNDGLSPYEWDVYVDGDNIVCFLGRNRKRDDE